MRMGLHAVTMLRGKAATAKRVELGMDSGGWCDIQSIYGPKLPQGQGARWAPGRPFTSEDWWWVIESILYVKHEKECIECAALVDRDGRDRP